MSCLWTRLMGMVQTSHMCRALFLLFLLSNPTTSSWFHLLGILQICPFPFTSGSPSIVSYLGSCDGFEPVCLALVISLPGCALHAYLRNLSSMQVSLAPMACPGLLYGVNPPAVGLICCPVSALSNSSIPRAPQAVQASFPVWVLFFFLSSTLALIHRT